MKPCTAPAHVRDARLWCRLKADIRARTERWNAYASGQLVQAYKRAGGTFVGPKADKPLARWYAERWVDLSRPKPGGGYAPCGRSSASSSRADYPLCRPAKVAAKISPTEAKRWVAQKRAAGGAKATVRFPARAR